MRRALGLGIVAAIIAAGARGRPYGGYSLMGFRMEDPAPAVRMKTPKQLDLTGALDPKPKGKRGKRRAKHK